MPTKAAGAAGVRKPPRIPSSRNVPGQTVLPGMTALEPAKKKRIPWEQIEQETLFYWLRLWEQKRPILHFVYHTPNGLFLHGKVAQDAEKMGVLAGVWDVCCPLARMDADGRYVPTLWLEMKHGDNKLTREQEAFRDAVAPGGARFEVCYTWIDAAYLITDYLGVRDAQIDQVLSVNRKASIKYATPDPLA